MPFLYAKGATMAKKLLRLVLAVVLVFGSLLFISVRDILAAPPVVTGVEDGKYYNVPVTIEFDDVEGTVTATLNDVSILSPYPVEVDGTYVLVVTDGVETTTINFWIDTVDPEVIGVVEGEYYNTSVSAVFTDTSPVSATLNGAEYISGTPISTDDSYTLVVTDAATNVTTVNFTIDKTPPVVIGVTDGSYYKENLIITFNEGTATLNDGEFTTGGTVSVEGNYTLIVTDLAGNITTVNFVLDKTAPVITIAPYNLDPTNMDITVNASTNEGSLNATSHIFTENGSFTFIATDLAGNVTEETVTITNIDKIPPVVIGVEDGMYYNSNRTPTFNEGTATLNGLEYMSGTLINQENDYILIVTDDAGNVTTVNFTIDKTPPVVIGVTDGSYYKENLIITFNEGTATLNDGEFTTGGTVSVEGNYTLIVTDLAGNITTVNFVLDKTAPVITIAPYNLDPTNKDITVNASTNEGSLNATSHIFTENGSFTFIATDLAGNVTEETVTITNIDKIPPVVIGVEDGMYYNSNRTPTFNEGTATLNDGEFTSGETISVEGNYTLIVTDDAGNVTTVNFTIDKTPPVVIGVTDGSYYKENLIITFNEGTATLNDGEFTTGGTVSVEGNYTLIVTDLAGNITTVNFVLDKTAPVITIAPYNLDPTNKDITVNASTNEGSLNATSHIFTENGSFTFIATDLAGNVTEETVTITNIDKIPPVVIGVEDGMYYNSNRTPTFNEGTATLNGLEYMSGTLINQENDYILIVTDDAGNVTTVNFTIDKTPPVVIGVTDGSYYKENLIITFNEGTATLNDGEFTTGGTVSVEGNYTLIVTDLAGNITTVNFVLDKTAPVITIAPYNLDPTNMDITVNASTNEGSLNATSHTFTENGSFTFIATDLAGNVTEETVTITNIDKDAPAVSGVSNNAYYNNNRTITFDKGTATLNGLPFTSGSIVSDEGSYTLIVSDDAGNSTTVYFTIDKTPPIVTGAVNNTHYNTNRTITFNEGSATLNSVTFTSGTIVSAENTYVLVVTDLAGNVTTVNFVIDKTLPIVSGVVNNTHYNTNRTITFNEGSATLNSVAFTSGTIVSAENTYVLVVTDLAGNVTTVNFVIDKTLPIVSGVANNTHYNTNRTITFNEGSATLNSVAFTSGTIVSAENTYVLVVTDLAGNVTTVNFVIDKTPPVITIAPYEAVLPVSSVTVNASVNEGSLNTSSRLFTANGSYTFTATDLAGNSSQRTVTITNIGYTLNYSRLGVGGDLIAMVNNIVVNSGNLVIEGKSITFTATPATRHRVYAWRLDGTVVGDRSNTYLLNMLNKGINVTVEFVMEGDLNNSGSVTVSDLVILRRYLAGLDTIGDKAKVAADVNNSGAVTVSDVVILRRRLAGLE
jgi:hypothetical protein